MSDIHSARHEGAVHLRLYRQSEDSPYLAGPFYRLSSQTVYTRNIDTQSTGGARLGSGTTTAESQIVGIGRWQQACPRPASTRNDGEHRGRTERKGVEGWLGSSQ